MQTVSYNDNKFVDESIYYMYIQVHKYIGICMHQYKGITYNKKTKKKEQTHKSSQNISYLFVCRWTKLNPGQ